MVSSIPNPFSRFQQLLLLVAILCIAATSYASEADINTICSKTPNAALCHKIVESIPGAARLDLPTLGKNFMNDTMANITGTMNLIGSLLNKTTNPQVKKNLSLCSGALANSVSYLISAEAEFKPFNYELAAEYIADGWDSVVNCKKAIRSSVPAVSNNIEILDLDGLIIMQICFALTD